MRRSAIAVDRLATNASFPASTALARVIGRDLVFVPGSGMSTATLMPRLSTFGTTPQPTRETERFVWGWKHSCDRQPISAYEHSEATRGTQPR